MTDTRENWTSRSGFIIAAVGSAVGLGNIWRFPYVAYENGGGAFLIPYLIALITAGLPLLFLDYAVGHKSSGSPPKAYRKLFRGGETLGWWQVCVCIIIGLYYASVLTWAGSYVYFSIGQMWGHDPEGFFFKTYLQTSDAAGFDPRFVSHIFWPLAGIWALTYGAAVLLNSSFYQRYLGSRDSLKVAYIEQALALPLQHPHTQS